MGNRHAYRDYQILFMIQEEEKRVYMEISFAKDVSAVLRKHWNGENRSTEAYFSYRNATAKPEMRVLEIGYVRRNTAKIFLNKWAEAFRGKGYQVIGTQFEDEELNEKQFIDYLNRAALQKIDLDKVLQGTDVEIITCHKSERKKKSAEQKYAVEPVDSVLNIRTTTQLAEAYRNFCKENNLTQNQGLALLLAGTEENARKFLNADIRERLCIADAALAERDRVISHLRKELEEERNTRQESKKDYVARIQHSLLGTFFESLPTPVFAQDRMKCWSVKSSQEIFPEEEEYHFPNQDGVLILRLDHVRYARANSTLLIIYGQTEAGEKIKLCWRIYDKNRYGRYLLDSPYLIKGYPWSFAVYSPKEIAYAVGCLPLFDLDHITQWYADPDDDDPTGMTDYFEVSFLHEAMEAVIEDRDSCPKTDAEDQDSLHDPNTFLEQKIHAAESKKRHR